MRTAAGRETDSPHGLNESRLNIAEEPGIQRQETGPWASVLPFSHPETLTKSQLPKAPRLVYEMEGNVAVGTNSHKTHGGFYTDVKYIIFIMGLYTSWFATRDKDSANGSLTAGNSPRLGSRSINSRFRKNIREFETDIKRVKREGWGDTLPGSGPTGWHWATFLTSASRSRHTLGIIVASQFSLVTVVILYEVTTDTELVKSEPGKTQG